MTDGRGARVEAALRECVVSLEQFKRLVAQQNVPHWWVQEDEDALVMARAALATLGVPPNLPDAERGPNMEYRG